MPALDVRTVFLMLGLLYLVLPTIAWVVLAKQQSRSVALWCGGGLMIGGGVILVGLNQFVPSWASLGLANILILGSHFARIQSLRLDLGIPWTVRWMAVVAMILTAIYAGIYFGAQDTVLRKVFSSTVTVVFLTHLTVLAWRIGREEQSRNAKWIAGVYGLVALIMLARAISMLIEGSAPAIIVPEMIHVLLSVSLLLSAVVGHFCYVGLALDRSMRRELKAASELARDEVTRRLGEQIAQLDRQRSLGELSASLGHELNQPLASILTNTQVAMRGLRANRFDSQQLTEFLEKIERNTKRASQIIERIRDYIQPSASRMELVNLNRTVFEVAELIADEARSHKVSISLPDPERRILVKGDPIQLSQILLNMFRNAIEALTHEEVREIRVTGQNIQGRSILAMRDSGPGLTRDVLAKIGTPFFSTKTKGLGMGFSISRAIAIQHGGTLTLANTEDSGAIVELNLPAFVEE